MEWPEFSAEFHLAANEAILVKYEIDSVAFGRIPAAALPRNLIFGAPRCVFRASNQRERKTKGKLFSEKLFSVITWEIRLRDVMTSVINE